MPDARSYPRSVKQDLQGFDRADRQRVYAVVDVLVAERDDADTSTDERVVVVELDAGLYAIVYERVDQQPWVVVLAITRADLVTSRADAGRDEP